MTSFAETKSTSFHRNICIISFELLYCSWRSNILGSSSDGNNGFAPLLGNLAARVNAALTIVKCTGWPPGGPLALRIGRRRMARNAVDR